MLSSIASETFDVANKSSLLDRRPGLEAGTNIGHMMFQQVDALGVFSIRFGPEEAEVRMTP